MLVVFNLEVEGSCDAFPLLYLLYKNKKRKLLKDNLGCLFFFFAHKKCVQVNRMKTSECGFAVASLFSLVFGLLR